MKDKIIWELKFVAWWVFRFMPNTMFGIMPRMFDLRYNKHWNGALKALLDSGSKVSLIGSGYSARVGKFNVWVGNPWYSYGNEYGWPRTIGANFRPSHRTIYKLHLVVTKLQKERSREEYSIYKNNLLGDGGK